MFKQHEQIVLTSDVVGDEGEELKPGNVGTVIHVYPADAADVVEFMSLDGATRWPSPPCCPHRRVP